MAIRLISSVQVCTLWDTNSSVKVLEPIAAPRCRFPGLRPWILEHLCIPSGSIGKAFVSEIARLFQAYADSSSLESIAMKAITVLQVLLLQKPSRTSKSSDHVKHLKRRLQATFIPLQRKGAAYRNIFAKHP